MRSRMVVVLLVAFLVLGLAVGLAGANPENEDPPDPSNDSETTPIEVPYLGELIDAITEMREQLSTYLEEIQKSVQDLFSEREPEPVEEFPELPEDEVPTTGVVEGRLIDGDQNPLSERRITMNARETTTDGNGFFFFEEVDFGSYDLYLRDPNTQENVHLTGFQIDQNNPRYSVNFTVASPPPESETEEVEVVPAPVEEETEPSGGAFLFLLGILVLLIIAVMVTIRLRRKHIRIVDEKSGEVIGTQKIKVYPKTKIDLTKAFEYAYHDAVRVQFLKPVIQKLSGARVVFLNDGKAVDQIDEYKGELEYPVKLPELPQEPDEAKPEASAASEEESDENTEESDENTSD